MSRRQVKSVTVQFTGAKVVDAGVKLIITAHSTYLGTWRVRKWKKMKGKGGAG
jgi:cytochrome oxidase assembly protein ShyY1